MVSLTAQVPASSLSGTVTDAQTSEPIIGAYVEVLDTDFVTATDADGSYRLSGLTGGQRRVVFSSVGFATDTVSINIYANVVYDHTMSAGAVELEGVNITATGQDNVRTTLTGVEQLSIEELNRQSKFLGETDVIRGLSSLTGVTSTGEGASGFNVRGGNTDENLILMDNNLIFNPVHALGFFSLFHPDMVDNVTLYKGGVPAKYGGRLSSVLDVRLRETDVQRLSLRGGLGVASSRLVVETPVGKIGSFSLGGRASYFDWILAQTKNVDLRSSQASFQDLTAKGDFRLTNSLKVGFTGLITGDNFRFADEVRFAYETQSIAAYAKQRIGDKFNLTATVNAGNYASDLFDIAATNPSKFTNEIGYLRSGLTGFYQASDALQLEFGGSSDLFTTRPGALAPAGDDSNVQPFQLPQERGRENSFHANLTWTLSDKLEIIGGLRYTIFDNLGPDQVFQYADGEPLQPNSVVDSIQFGENEVVASYTGWEPRISARLTLGPVNSIKLGYNRSYQYLSQISNTASAAPIDLWQLSNFHVQPQRADNFSVGYYHDFKEGGIQTYAVAFYRDIDNLIEFKDFARLLLNPQIETELVYGDGRAYGLELFFKKTYGRHRFEVNYTYSRSQRRIPETPTQRRINRGEYYPANFDKPHVLNANYFLQINERNSFSANFTYSTGRPATAPVASFASDNILTIPVFSERNQFRIPAYHRADVAYTVGPWGKADKRLKSSLTFSIYNLYFRKNAFSVFFRQNPFSGVQTFRVAVLGTAFPAVTYNFTF